VVSPRARGDIVRPRLSSGGIDRPSTSPLGGCGDALWLYLGLVSCLGALNRCAWFSWSSPFALPARSRLRNPCAGQPPNPLRQRGTSSRDTLTYQTSSLPPLKAVRCTDTSELSR